MEQLPAGAHCRRDDLVNCTRHSADALPQSAVAAGRQADRCASCHDRCPILCCHLRPACICCQPALVARHWCGRGGQYQRSVVSSHPAFSGRAGLGWLYRPDGPRLDAGSAGFYIRTARAFGLPNWLVTYRYALTIAILPTITLLGVGIGRCFHLPFAELSLPGRVSDLFMTSSRRATILL